MTQVASFDVFDTVLTRLLGGADEVPVETGRRLWAAGVIGVSAQAYAQARRSALADLTKDVGLHPTLEDVVREVVDRLGLPQSAGAVLLTTELEVERDTCRAVPGAAARVEQARRSTGRGVVYVSDTSMPEDDLRALLVREDLFVDGDALHTSAASRASKQQGRLFDVVAAAHGLPPEAFDHVGDDRWADVAHPRLHGWRATLDARAGLTTRERRLGAASAATDGFGARLAGASRMGRLRAVAEGVDPDLAGLAGAVALPLLAGFGLWVTTQARLLGLDRLYFVARDGEVFLDVTGALMRSSGTSVECRYLYGSRKSWQSAGAGTRRHEQRGETWLPDAVDASALSARSVLALDGLSPSEAHALTGLDLFTPGQADAVLGERGWDLVREALMAAPLRDELTRRARVERDLLLRYLDQEGVTAPGRVGLVDVGWTGRAARALEDVLQDGGRPLPAAHLFLGLLAEAPGVMGPELHGRSHGWLLDAARGRGLPPGATEDPVMLVESFAMGREGHTTGYALDGERVVPTLVSPQNAAAAHWEFEGYRTALGHAVEALVESGTPDSAVDLRPLAVRQLLDFWRAPSRGEAAAWGAQPYGEDFHNASTHPLATPLTLPRLLTRAGLGPRSWRQPTYWPAGTVVISPPPWRQLAGAASVAVRARPRLRRIPRRLRAEIALRRP